MRLTTYLGFGMGVLLIYGVVVAKGGDFSIFTNVVALAICAGGTIAATTLSSSIQTARLAASAMSRLFVRRTLTAREVGEQLVVLARQAKVGGLTSLDVKSLVIDDPFLRTGLQLAIDGVEPERIEDLLRLEASLLSEKRKSAERMFRLMGTYSPMFGLIGTLIGLIQMLKGLADPRAIGQGMSVALMATFYGVLFAGMVFLPLAGKVRTLDLEERMLRDQMLAGLLAMRMGENPQVVRETVEVFAKD